MKKSLWLIGLVLFISWSCKRDYEDKGFIGTPFISASENFQITSPLSVAFPTTVNFANAEIQEFNASFNEKVTWELQLTGIKSGATFLMKGTSDALDASNASWNGRHDGIYFFESNDSVVASLKVIGYKDILTTSFKIAPNGQKNYTTGNPNLSYILRTNFELIAPANAPINDQNINLFPTQFSISPPGIITGSVLQNDEIRAPEGFRFGRVAGLSTASNGFFVGGIQHRRPNANLSSFYINWTDPEQVYVNIYVRGVDNMLPNSRPVAVLNFEFHEDDRDDRVCGTIPSTPNDRHCPTDEDSWVFRIPISHTGWKLFSNKYSNLTPGEDAANGGSGNRILQPDRIFRVQMGLISNPPFNYVQAEFDFACFTLGAPFDPKTF
ncbi:MAG: hypothetical protein MUE33_01450 [Cytophagaceae bacterium]|jgi:hypothetical protein|nr:hypothetical protein [Cytophagaceae bacterium]